MKKSQFSNNNYKYEKVKNDIDNRINNWGDNKLKQIPKNNKSKVKQKNYSENLVEVINKAGSLLVSDGAFKFIYDSIVEHINVLNYFISNIGSKLFWLSLKKVSFILFIISLLSNIIGKSYLRFDLFGTIYVITFLVLEIILRDVHALELRYNTVEYIKQNKIKNEEVKEVVDKESIKPPVDKPKLKLREQPLTEGEENKTPMRNIREMHKELMSRKAAGEVTFTNEDLDETLNEIPEVRNKMVYNSTSEQLLIRENLRKVLERAGKNSPSEVDGDKYMDLLI